MKLFLRERYQLVREVERVGDVVTHLAGDVTNGDVVRVQVFHGAAHLEDTLRRYQHLTHPGLITSLDSFEEDGDLFLVQPNLDTKVFAEWVRNDEPTIKEIVRAILQIVDVLNYLHSQRIPRLHGDMRPENIVMVPERALVRDVGGALATGLTLEGPCQPPEQAGRAAVPSDDLFALASAVVSVLSDTPPSSVTSDQAEDCGLPANVAVALSACLAEDPADRVQDVGGFMDLLQSTNSRIREAEAIAAAYEDPTAPEHVPTKGTEVAETDWSDVDVDSIAVNPPKALLTIEKLGEEFARARALDLPPPESNMIAGLLIDAPQVEGAPSYDDIPEAYRNDALSLGFQPMAKLTQRAAGVERQTLHFVDAVGIVNLVLYPKDGGFEMLTFLGDGGKIRTTTFQQFHETQPQRIWAASAGLRSDYSRHLDSVLKEATAPPVEIPNVDTLFALTLRDQRDFTNPIVGSVKLIGYVAIGAVGALIFLGVILVGYLL